MWGENGGAFLGEKREISAKEKGGGGGEGGCNYP